MVMVIDVNVLSEHELPTVVLFQYGREQLQSLVVIRRDAEQFEAVAGHRARQYTDDRRQ